MTKVNVQKIPTVFRWLQRLAGLAILLAPVVGTKIAIEQHHSQGPSMRRGRESPGFEVRGQAAIALGIGLACIGLSLGYGFAFRLSRKTAFETNRIDRFALLLLGIGIVCFLLSWVLPTRTEI